MPLDQGPSTGQGPTTDRRGWLAAAVVLVIVAGVALVQSATDSGETTVVNQPSDGSSTATTTPHSPIWGRAWSMDAAGPGTFTTTVLEPGLVVTIGDGWIPGQAESEATWNARLPQPDRPAASQAAVYVLQADAESADEVIETATSRGFQLSDPEQVQVGGIAGQRYDVTGGALSFLTSPSGDDLFLHTPGEAWRMTVLDDQLRSTSPSQSRRVPPPGRRLDPQLNPLGVRHPAGSLRSEMSTAGLTPDRSRRVTRPGIPGREVAVATIDEAVAHHARHDALDPVGVVDRDDRCHVDLGHRIPPDTHRGDGPGPGGPIPRTAPAGATVGQRRDPRPGPPRQPQAPASGQRWQAGSRGVHTSAPRSIIAWFQSHGSAPSAQSSADRCASPGVRRSSGHPGQDPGHVGVDHGGGELEGERPDGPSGVGTDAGQAHQLVELAGEPTIERLDHLDRRPMQADGAVVVAEPGPQGDHLGPTSACGITDGRQATQEAAPGGCDPGDLRLLEHHLGHQDGPRVAGRGARAGRGGARRAQAWTSSGEPSTGGA